MKKIYKYKRVLFLTLILTGITFGITLLTSFIHYKAALNSKKSALIDDVIHERELIQSLYDQGVPKDSILKTVITTNTSFLSIGKTGEFIIAESHHDSIKFLCRKTYKVEIMQSKVYLKPEIGIPLKMALSEISGFVQGNDYRGVEVFAGVTHFKPFRWALVTKIDVAEFNKPFVDSLILTLILAFIFTFIGALLFIKITNPLIDEIVRSEENLSITLNSIGDGVITTNEHGLVTRLNPVAEYLCGWNSEDAKGKPIEEIFCIVNANTRTAVINPVKTVIEKGTIVGLANHTLLISKDGREYQIADSAAPIKNKEGKIVGVVFTFHDVTEKYETEKKLSEIEKKVRLLFEEMGNGLVIGEAIYNESGNMKDVKCIDINKAGENLIGIRKEDWFGKTLLEFMPNIEKFSLEIFDKVIKTGESLDFDTYLPGLNRYFNILAYKIQLNQFAIILKDITERKKIEIELKSAKEKAENNEKRLNEAQNLAHIGSWELDLTSNNLVWSDEVFNIFGCKPQEFAATYEAFLSFVYPEDRDYVNNSYLNHINTRIPYDIIHRILLPTGEIKYVNEKCRSDFDDQGKPIRSIGTVQDITEKKIAEEEIKKLLTAIEQLNVAIIITDKYANIQYANPFFAKLTGYTKDEVIGKNMGILKSGNTSKEKYEQMWDTLISGKNWHGELLNKKKNGELYWALNTISPIIDNNGIITNYIAIQYDITNRKKMIDELINAKEKAEEMNRVKANFFANMSHELRTPFVGILGFAEILAETVTDPEALSMVNSIIESGKRLTDTLNKILSLSKLEFDEIQPIFQPVKINELLNDTYNLFINSFDKSLINYKLQLLPKELKIITDEKLLRGILINLINNAIKYTPKGEISVSAKTITRGEKNFLQLVVSDTGIGIPKDKQEVIFEPFRQASEGINRSYEGTGLGLTIVRKYVDLLNGTIKLNSDIGLGTTITIELPFKEITKKETQNKEEEKTEMNNEIIYQQTIAPKKLLYVEDDEVSQSVVTKTLSKYYEIDLVKSAEEALNILKEKTYDALLIDVNLGFGMDGVQLTEKIRTMHHYRNVPIIAVTAYASELDRQEFLSRGFSHYISKPFGIKDLIKLVASVFYTDK